MICNKGLGNNKKVNIKNKENPNIKELIKEIFNETCVFELLDINLVDISERVFQTNSGESLKNIHLINLK
jgi:hypothetical protein